ncbi:MAG: cbb3-type cytochrome c oxidase subunit 3 [Candidimonas sp.]|nr:MAG: cbb3-type cytochrome c oxidase subunit 3 [Candidimonas sp.]TAM19941.1 MAG: cbb3-type cytochrome c oxidase subunit 3 [Candidimonas sp.]TAM76445.1 MAG: cbb3-type cytochrome c oxidase subunit 3 [Candidimonas sp.]
MNPIWGLIAGGLIVFMMLVFICIWIWAWLPYHRRSFGELARIPMADDDDEEDPTITRGDRS